MHGQTTSAGDVFGFWVAYVGSCCQIRVEGLRCLQEFEGADVRFGSVADIESLSTVAFSEPVDVVVSCLASRTGGKVGPLVLMSHPE